MLTREAHWRESQGVEPMHQYYTGFDLLTDAEIDSIYLEDDGIPQDLNFKDTEDIEQLTLISRAEFEDWLREGRDACEIGASVLHMWLHSLQGSDQDTISDFYDLLLAECEAHNAVDTEQCIQESRGSKLNVEWLADID